MNRFACIFFTGIMVQNICAMQQDELVKNYRQWFISQGLSKTVALHKFLDTDWIGQINTENGVTEAVGEIFGAFQESVPKYFLKELFSRIETDNTEKITQLITQFSLAELRSLSYYIPKGEAWWQEKKLVHWLSRKGHVQALRRVVTGGLSVHERNLHGDTALSFAAMNGHRDVVQALFDMGVRVDNVADAHDVLIGPVLFGNSDLVELLLRNGVHAHEAPDGKVSVYEQAVNLEERCRENPLRFSKEEWERRSRVLQILDCYRVLTKNGSRESI